MSDIEWAKISQNLKVLEAEKAAGRLYREAESLSRQAAEKRNQAAQILCDAYQSAALAIHERRKNISSLEPPQSSGHQEGHMAKMSKKEAMKKYEGSKADKKADAAGAKKLMAKKKAKR